MKYYTEFKTDFCKIILVGDEDGICNLHWENEGCKRHFEISGDWVRNDSFFVDAVKEIKEYFAGKRKTFGLKLAPQGTDFQKRIWNELRKISYGELRSYQDIAMAIGNKKACRAVGMANSKNPIPLLIPCHRVIGKNGKLTGFAHGLDSKEKLIDMEKKYICPCS
jgi:methylated-DNA-[protein]-cysteine S-methyltransferase